MDRLLTMSKGKLALAVVTSFLVVVVVSILVPLAQGGSASAPETGKVLGVSENQRVISDQAELDERLSDRAYDLKSADLDLVAEASMREELEYIDTEAFEHQIEQKRKGQEALEKKQVDEREAQRKAEAEVKRKAEEAQKAAEAAKKKEEQEKKAQSSVSSEAGWKKVIASCYHDVGGLLATGETLQAHDLIIAHKELPLGTRVELEYQGNKVIAQVRDRGPYVSGRDIDLAPAVQAALGLYDGVKSVNMRILG